ncbi:MAG: acyltransferase [Bacteroidaceae bacterium]|nr:acyltransferase [Bacteroidaceae bacterium]
MSDTKKTTLTFRLLKKLHLITDEEKHGRINPFSLIAFVFSTLWRRFIFNYAYQAYILEFLYKKHLRPAIWRSLGCKVGKNVHIGHQVRLDFGNAKRITIEDDVVLANGVTLWCHMRDMKSYRVGMKAMDLPAKYGDIHLGKGCYVGLNVTILPGVHIGEGAVIGSCALVTKDIPAWTIATGVPARVVKNIEKE